MDSWRSARHLFPVLALLLFIALLAQSPAIGRSIRAAFRDGPPPDVFLERYPQLADLARTDAVKELPHFRIKLRQRELEKLVERRDRALKERYLYSEDDDYVSADVRLDDQRARIKLRLKGDFTDQFRDHKWSFRVKVRGDQTLLGMRIFSLQSPEARRYLAEWATHKMMKEANVPSLRYQFVTVSINDRYHGIFALEEHFDKRLIENNFRREGPVLKISEDEFFHAIFDGKKDPPRDELDRQFIFSSEIQTFRLNSIMKNPVQYGFFLDGQSLLEDFRQGRRDASDVFDSEVLARYYALNHIACGVHGHRWHNVRFYYNPITSRLEPVGFDFNESKRPENILNFEKFARPDGGGIFHVWGFDPLSRIIFQDPEVFAAYMRNMKELADSNFLADFFEKYDSEINHLEEILRAEYPKYRFESDNFFKNAKYLLSVIRRHHVLESNLAAHDRSGLTLAFKNKSEMHLEIESISWGQENYEPTTRQIVKSDLFGDGRPESPFSARYPIHISEDELASVRIHYRVLGSDLRDLRTSIVMDNAPAATTAAREVESEHSKAAPARDLGPLHHKSNFQDFPFLQVDERARTLSFQRGHLRIDRNLVLPRGYEVLCGPGTQIELTAGASIISYSPLRFAGTADDPIVVSALEIASESDGMSATEEPGQGLLVVQAGAPSLLQYVHFENLGAPESGNWLVTGAVTFYESDVTVSNSVFANNRSEDALNIVRSRYRIESSEFRGTQADAFDADFTEGALRDVTFRECGNDAIDVSGSRVALDSIRIYSAGDKGISVGEGSTATIENVEIDGCETGIASKDFSGTRLIDTRINRCTVGLAVYQKKAEFGGGFIEASSIDLSGADLPYIIELGSSIELDGDSLNGYGRRKETQVLGRITSGVGFN